MTPPSAARPAARVLAGLAGAAPVAGCTASPAQNILGAYFPSWLICAVAGVVVTAIVRQLCVMAGLERNLLAAPLVYVAFALATTLLVWLLVFGNA